MKHAMDKVLTLMEDIGRYLSLLKITDLVDVAIIVFLVYKLLSLVKSKIGRAHV